MEQDTFLASHDGSRREVKLSGQVYFHLHCKRCGRDFVKVTDVPGWRAVHIGIFRFDFLDDLTTKRWVSEECTGQPRMAEMNDLRLNGAPKALLERPTLGSDVLKPIAIGLKQSSLAACAFRSK